MGRRWYWWQSVVKAALYIEGGGTGGRLGQLFRNAWRDFFVSAGLAGSLPRIVRGGGRQQTFEQFSAAIGSGRTEELPILLVDSEGPVESGRSAWEHLQANDRWARPPGVEDEQAFLMVQTMETWLLADRHALRDYFGPSFRENRLPSQYSLESIAKETVQQSLERATADCGKRYAKGSISFEILRRINPDAVSERCLHARAMLDCLRSL